MAYIYSVISILLLFLFVFFYFKSSNISLFILLISVYTNITMPPLFGLDIQLFKIQILIGLLITINRYFQINSYAQNLRLLADNKLSRSIIIYFLFLFVSMLFFSRQYNFVGSISMSIDYSLTYFVVLPILIKQNNWKSFIDIVLISTSFYVFIGIVGYFLNDPLFGTFYYDDNIINLRSSSLSYFEKINQIDSYLRDEILISNSERIKFLSSDPNSLASLLLVNFLLILYKIFDSKKKLFWTFMLIIYSICLVLTGSRTLIIVTILGLLLISLKKRSSLFITSILIFIALVFFDIENLLTISRFSDLNSNADLLDANGRNIRWIYHLRKLSINNVLIGDGSTGFEGSFSQMSHNNYLGLLYKVGAIGFLAYCYSLYRVLSLIRINFNKFEESKYFNVIVISLILIGFTQETLSARGPATLLYCLFAYLSIKKVSIEKFNSSNKY